MHDVVLILRPFDGYRRPGTAQRTLTTAPLVPSQDVCRYQARDMPPPTYDLDRTEAPSSVLTVLILTLAVVTIGAGVALIDRIGTWLSP